MFGYIQMYKFYHSREMLNIVHLQFLCFIGCISNFKVAIAIWSSLLLCYFACWYVFKKTQTKLIEYQPLWLGLDAVTGRVHLCQVAGVMCVIPYDRWRPIALGSRRVILFNL